MSAKASSLRLLGNRPVPWAKSWPIIIPLNYLLVCMDLLILDDFGLQNLDKQQRDLLREIIEDRYNKRSTIIASQLLVSKWYEIIGEGTIADAILDRLVHGA